MDRPVPSWYAILVFFFFVALFGTSIWLVMGKTALPDLEMIPGYNLSPSGR